MSFLLLRGGQKYYLKLIRATEIFLFTSKAIVSLFSSSVTYIVLKISKWKIKLTFCQKSLFLFHEIIYFRMYEIFLN